MDSNMKSMYVTIWAHHMQIDEMFDFLNDRIDTPPAFWYNQEECPHSITGGYAALSLTYEDFSKLRSVRDWEDPFQQNHYASFRAELEETEFEEWNGTLTDGFSGFEFGEWDDYSDEEG